MMQPPLHSHVPVTHPVADLHTEVCVVAVDVLDGLEVVLGRNVRIQTGHTRENIRFVILLIKVLNTLNLLAVTKWQQTV